MTRGKHKNHTSGSDHYRWNNGRIISSHGYVRIRVGKGHRLADRHGYAYEHRVVAEKALNRRLTKNEVVHHIDGDKTNNSLDNLSVEGRGFHSIVTHPRERGGGGRFVERTGK